MNTVIIVLGAPNDKNGNLSSIAISLTEYKKNKNCKVLCTGGFGEHFNITDKPHGFYTKNYLMQNGIHSSVFLEIALSSNTREDAELSKPILEKNGIDNAILVTSEFHMERAKLLFNKAMPEIKFEYSEAITDICESDFQKLIEHEKNAIKRELEKIK